MIVLTYDILRQIQLCRDLESAGREWNKALHAINVQLAGDGSTNTLDLRIRRQTVRSLVVDYEERYQRELFNLALMVLSEFSPDMGDSSPMPSRK